MMLICPACATHYEVAATKISAGGRSVKCAACEHVWVATPVSEVETTVQTLNFKHQEAFSGGLEPPRASREIGQNSRSSYGRGRDRGGAYFSRPVTSVQGNAALAALFDDYPAQDHDKPHDIVEGEWQAVNAVARPAPTPAPDMPMTPSFSIEDRLEAALSASPIARRQLAQRRALAAANAASTGPFHGALAEAAAGTELAVVPAPVTQTPPETPEVLPPDDFVTQESLRREAGSALRVLARIVVTAFNKAGDQLESLIPKNLFKQKSVSQKRATTPGDRQVSRWREHERRRARNKMTPLRFFGWTVWGMALVSVVVGSVVFRTDIMKFWPETKSAYGAIGLSAIQSPIVLKDVTQRYALSNKGPVIELRGALVHTGETLADTPLIQANAYDARGQLLASWIFRTNGARQMQPTMEIPFLTRTLTPTGVSQVALSLVPASVALVGRLAPLGENETGQSEFFMQKTSGGWSAETDAPPPSGP